MCSAWTAWCTVCASLAPILNPGLWEYCRSLSSGRHHKSSVPLQDMHTSASGLSLLRTDKTQSGPTLQDPPASPITPANPKVPPPKRQGAGFFTKEGRTVLLNLLKTRGIRPSLTIRGLLCPIPYSSAQVLQPRHCYSLEAAFGLWYGRQKLILYHLPVVVSSFLGSQQNQASMSPASFQTGSADSV